MYAIHLRNVDEKWAGMLICLMHGQCREINYVSFPKPIYFHVVSNHFDIRSGNRGPGFSYFTTNSINEATRWWKQCLLMCHVPPESTKRSTLACVNCAGICLVTGFYSGGCHDNLFWNYPYACLVWVTYHQICKGMSRNVHVCVSVLEVCWTQCNYSWLWLI